MVSFAIVTYNTYIKKDLLKVDIAACLTGLYFACRALQVYLADQGPMVSLVCPVAKV